MSQRRSEKQIANNFVRGLLSLLEKSGLGIISDLLKMILTFFYRNFIYEGTLVVLFLVMGVTESGGWKRLQKQNSVEPKWTIRCSM